MGSLPDMAIFCESGLVEAWILWLGTKGLASRQPEPGAMNVLITTAPTLAFVVLLFSGKLTATWKRSREALGGATLELGIFWNRTRAAPQCF